MRLLTAVSGVRVPQQAPEKKPIKVSFFVLLSLLLSRTTYAVFGLHDSRVQNRCRKYAIPSHGVLLTAVRVRGQAPEKKPNGFFFIFLFLLLSRTPYAVFGLHDSRVQNRCRKCAIPSRSALLTGVRVPQQAPNQKRNLSRFLFYFVVSLYCFFSRTFDFSVSFGSDVQRAEGKGGGEDVGER